MKYILQYATPYKDWKIRVCWPHNLGGYVVVNDGYAFGKNRSTQILYENIEEGYIEEYIQVGKTFEFFKAWVEVTKHLDELLEPVWVNI